MMSTIFSRKKQRIQFCTVLLILCNGLYFEHELIAQPEETTSEIKIRKIFVPQGNEKQWPKGDWIPVKKQQLEALLSKQNENEESKKPSRLRLNQTLYELKINAKNELEGTFRSEIQSAIEKRESDSFQVLPLTKTNLNFSNLESEFRTIKKKTSILWGTDSSGRNYALVPNNAYRIHGLIKSYGNDFGDALEFRLLLPKSQQSRILLTLPISWNIEISNGKILGSKMLPEKQMKLWNIQLGTSNELLLQILKTNQASKSKTTLFCTENHSWSIAQNTALLQSEYQFEVLGKPISQFSWDIPEEISVDSVTLGGDVPVKFETRLRGTRKILVVRLPEPLSGKSRSLFIRANVRPEYETDWSVPNLRTRNAVITKSATGIRINHPLDIQNYQIHGYQQTAVKFDSGNSQLFRFEKLLPDGKLVFNISQPSSELFSRTFIQTELREKRWKSETKIFLGARRGQQNMIRLLVPQGWEIRKVSAATADSTESELNGWRIRISKGKRILEIQLFNPVSPSNFKRLTINAAYPKTNFEKRKINFVMKVMDCDDQDIILEFLNSYNWKVKLASSRNSKFLSSYSNDTTPVSWGEFSPLEEDFKFSTGSNIWRMTENTSKNILFEVNAQNVDIANRVAMRYFVKDAYLFCQSDLILDSDSFKNENRDRNDSYQLLAYFTHTPKLPTWTLHSGPEVSPDFNIKTTLLEQSHHREFNLPADGSLWRISISKSEQKPNSTTKAKLPTAIHIRWARPLVEQFPLPLCFIVNGELSQGNLRINYDEGKDVEIATSKTVVELPETNKANRNYFYRFQKPTEAVSISTASDARPVSTIAQPELSVQTKIPPNVNRPTEFRLLYDWQSPVRSEDIRISLPTETEIIALRVNGIPAKVRVSSSQLVLPKTLGNQVESIELTGTSPQRIELLSIKNRLVFPELNVQPKSFRWQVDGVSEKEIFWRQHPVESTFSENFYHTVLGPWASFDKQNSRIQSFKFEAITSPSTLSFSIVRVELIQKIAWILFAIILIVTLLTKTTSKNGGRKLAFALMLGSSAAFGFLNSQYLIFCGAIFSASVISLLLPIELLKSSWKIELVRNAKVKASLPKWIKKRLLKTNLFLLIVLFPNHFAVAQSDSNTVEKQFDVLVPAKLDAEKPEESDIYYVDSKVLKRVLESESTKKANGEYIVRNANYRVLLDQESSPKVISTFLVSVYDNSFPTIEFSLPFHGMTFDGVNSCKVNGQVTDMIPLPDSKNVLIKLDQTEENKKAKAVENFKIEVAFYPEVKIIGDVQSFEITIPSVTASYTKIERSDEYATVSVIRANNDNISIPLKNEKPVWIGDTKTLKVLWSQKSAASISTTILKADLLTFVNVQPNLLRARFRANYTIESGQVRKFSWRLPSKSLVRSVDCKLLKSYSSQNQRNGLTRLDIELDRPVDESFQVEAEIDLPIRFLDKTVRIPAFDLFGSTGNSSRIQTGQLFIGFSSLDGFETKFEGARADLFSLVTTEKYLEQWGNAPPAISPGSVYQLASPVEFVATLNPREPKIKLNAVQTLEVHPTETVLRAEATVLPTEIPVYRYIIDCDPKFVLDSISVRQDGVERLSQWRRLGNELQLFLNGPSLTEQEIKIVGRLEIPVSTPTSIIPLKFQQTNTVSKNQLEIINLTTQVGTQISNVKGMTVLQQTKPQNDERQDSSAVTRNIGSIAGKISNSNHREFEIKERNASFDLKLFQIVDQSTQPKISAKEIENQTELPEEFLYEDVYFNAPLILHRIMKQSETALVGETAVWIRNIDSKFLYWNHIPGMSLLNCTINGEPLGEIYQSDTKWILPIQPVKDVCAITVNWKLELDQSEPKIPLPEPRLEENSIRFVLLNSMSRQLPIEVTSSKSLSNQEQLSLTKTILELIQTSSNRSELSFSTVHDWKQLVAMQLREIDNLEDSDQSTLAVKFAGEQLLKNLKESKLQTSEGFSSNQSDWILTESPIIELSKQSQLFGNQLAIMQVLLTFAIAYLLYRLGFTRVDEKIREFPRGTVFLIGVGMVLILPNSIFGYGFVLASIAWKISLILRGVQPMLPNPD